MITRTSLLHTLHERTISINEFLIKGMYQRLHIHSINRQVFQAMLQNNLDGTMSAC